MRAAQAQAPARVLQLMLGLGLGLVHCARGWLACGPAYPHAHTRLPALPPGANPFKKDSLNFVVHIVREFAALYGPVIILLENLHEFDTWSWQLLVKIAEVRVRILPKIGIDWLDTWPWQLLVKIAEVCGAPCSSAR